MAYADLNHFLTKVQSAANFSTLWDMLVRFQTNRDASYLCYTSLLPLGHDGKRYASFHDYGVPEEWRNYYRSNNIFDIDPVILCAKKYPQPFHFSQVPKLMDLNPRQKKYLEDLNKGGLGNAITIATYGPRGRNGVFAVGFEPGKDLNGQDRLNELQWSTQAVHLRHCTLSPPPEMPEYGLSPREREVLQWMAKGKSNSTIAVLTGLSIHTVDTNIRRIYRKLNVSDRVSAVVKGLGAGQLID